MFAWLEIAVSFLLYTLLGMDSASQLSGALHFFLVDVIKIFILLLSIIFIVTLLRSYVSTEKVRCYLQGKSTFTGNILAALFGIITPFCSCSAIPLFLGFMQARIPIGVTFSFLISAPLNNEIAIAMLLGLYGVKVALLYMAFGLVVAIFGGYVIGRLPHVERYVLIPITPIEGELHVPQASLHMRQRLQQAWRYTIDDIFKKIYLYVLLGVGVGAFIHGYVPADFIAKYGGGEAWYSVLLAVLFGVPMYANAAGVMPLVEVLTQKGMLLGSALSFMMAVTALSLPEALILKRILHIRLIALFFSIVSVGIIAVGYLFNALFAT